MITNVRNEMAISTFFCMESTPFRESMTMAAAATIRMMVMLTRAGYVTLGLIR